MSTAREREGPAGAILEGGYDSRLARQPASQPPWHSAFPLHHPPPYSLSVLFPYQVFLHHPLAPLSSLTRFHSHERRRKGIVCVCETSPKRADVPVCVPFSLGNAVEGCVDGQRGGGTENKNEEGRRGGQQRLSQARGRTRSQSQYAVASLENFLSI